MPRYTPEQMLGLARQLNPGKRFALRKYPDGFTGGAVLGAWNDRASGFVPAAIERGPDSGVWDRGPGVSAEIDGVTPGADPADWEE